MDAYFCGAAGGQTPGQLLGGRFARTRIGWHVSELRWCEVRTASNLPHPPEIFTHAYRKDTKLLEYYRKRQ